MAFFHLKNLSSTAAEDQPLPWESASVRPAFSTKDEYREWCKRPATSHYFYSAFEGINAGVRIGKENPAYRIHGLVADYDTNLGEKAIPLTVAKNAPLEFRPAWFSRTFSGGARLIWEFEQPVFCYHAAHLKDFLARCKKEFKCARLIAGLDEGVLSKPDQYYELGTDWQRVSDVRIASKTINLWLYQIGTKIKWSVEGTEIPIELVAEQVEKQFPGRWPGEFGLGVRGPRFWDPTADNDTAAIVRSAGMQCFTGETPFVPWASILGASFTRDFEANRIAQATDQIYYDNRHYWRRDDRGGWYFSNKEDISLFMRVKAGLARDPGRATSSEVDQAVFHIQSQNRVLAALPFVHRRPGLHREPDGLYLNTSNVQVCPPAEGALAWRENFPWLAGLLDESYFTSPDQWPFFMAWLQRFYNTAYEGQMARGHAVFLAGPVGQGKTFVATQVIGRMLGGASDVTSYMLGENSWNSSLIERAVWNVDDSGPGKDPRTHTIYSNNIKKHVANEYFDYQKKFTDAARARWTGRIIVTLNDDEESLCMLPDMDGSIMEKILLLRTANRNYDFPVNCEEIAHRELPFFCRWLLDWVAPELTLGNKRFGITHYHEPSLMAAAQERGKTHEFRELVETLLINHFRDDREATEWVGTATELYAAMADLPMLAAIVRKFNPTYIGRGLKKLVSREPGLVQFRTLKGRTLWTLNREIVGDLADETGG